MSADNKVIFLGTLYPANAEQEVASIAKVRPSSAPNVFQWNLLDGIKQCIEDRLSVVNVMPIGTWPHASSAIKLPTRGWECDGVKGHEIGCLNLPFVKQFMRAKKVERYLKREAKGKAELIIYSLYMPFLKAIQKLPRDIKVTAIVTDLPEYYDLHQTTSLRKKLRNKQNELIYKYLPRVDRFVVLTEQMCDRLNVGNRPWIRVEGVCNAGQEADKEQAATKKKAILYSGTLNYQYGITNLLDAFAALETQDVELWICGSGEAADEINRRAADNTKIKFFGFCSQHEVAQLRSKASVLVNPRTNDGEYTKYSFPSKTMEYMASGTPVVMYKLDGIPNEYDEYLNYACGGDPIKGLVNAIDQVFAEFENATERAVRAKEFVLKHKSGISQAKRILEFIRLTNKEIVDKEHS